jgi:hypothetical protein
MKSVLSALILVLFLSLSVQPSVMSDAVSLMSAGNWRFIVTTGMADSMIKSCPTSNENIFTWGCDGEWDPHSRQLAYIGSAHACPMKFIIYKESTNAWRDIDLQGSSNYVHSYDNNAMDTSGIWHYYVTDRVFRYNMIQDQWMSSLTGLGSSRYSAFEFFPELNGFVHVHGGNVSLYSLATGSWSSLGTAPMGDLHNLNEYNPVYKELIMGGGNNDARKLYIMDSTRAIRRLNDAPWDIHINSVLLTCDPVSGEYLALEADSLWAYKRTSDTWVSVARNPFYPGGVSKAIVTPINTYGVICFVSGYQFPVLLYKHTDSPQVVDGYRIAQKPEGVYVFPNPAFGSATIRFPFHKSVLRIFNVKGELVTGMTSQKPGSVKWNTAGLPRGQYLIRIDAAKKTRSAIVTVY